MKGFRRVNPGVISPEMLIFLITRLVPAGMHGLELTWWSGVSWLPGGLAGHRLLTWKLLHYREYPSGRVRDTHQLWFFHYYKEWSKIEGEVRTWICKNFFLFSGDPISNFKFSCLCKIQTLNEPRNVLFLQWEFSSRLNDWAGFSRQLRWNCIRIFVKNVLIYNLTFFVEDLTFIHRREMIECLLDANMDHRPCLLFLSPVKHKFVPF